jgi:hypothetical protein
MSSANASPKLGEAWRVDLEPVMGHEQGGRRPCLIVSIDDFDRIPHGLVWANRSEIRLDLNFAHPILFCIKFKKIRLNRQ